MIDTFRKLCVNANSDIVLKRHLENCYLYICRIFGFPYLTFFFNHVFKHVHLDGLQALS